jgi:23S rRNA (adenine2503-C2)-methyltransferase
MVRIALYDLPRRSLTCALAAWGFADAHAARLWKYLYREGLTDCSDMQELPPRLRERLFAEARLETPEKVHESAADGGLTTKFALGLHDGQRIETVLMRCHGRVTACLSSQAGCALGCVFCATGQMGFGRSLTTGEIVAQALHAARVVRETTLAAPSTPASARLRNVVLMGMGEPLLNYDAVLRAVDILGDSAGLAIAGKRTTLSTVGIVPGIVRLADEQRPCSLAVSLHAATQDERAAIVPAARTWPLDELLEACRYYTRKLRRRIFFEWTLIAGVNDSLDQARELARLVRGVPCQINLIPLNETGGYGGAACAAPSLDRFQQALRDAGLPATVRRRRGLEIAAGCGQLAADVPG